MANQIDLTESTINTVTGVLVKMARSRKEALDLDNTADISTKITASDSVSGNTITAYSVGDNVIRVDIKAPKRQYR